MIFYECKDMYFFWNFQTNWAICEKQTEKISKYIFSASLKFRCFSIACPSFLHRYSIACPSFRWSIYGELMDKRWRNLGTLGMLKICILIFFLFVFHKLLNLFGSFKKNKYLCTRRIKDRAPVLMGWHALPSSCEDASHVIPESQKAKDKRQKFKTLVLRP